MSQSYYSEMWMIPVQIHHDFRNNKNMSKLLIGIPYLFSSVASCFTILVLFKKWFGVVKIILAT